MWRVGGVNFQKNGRSALPRVTVQDSVLQEAVCGQGVNVSSLTVSINSVAYFPTQESDSLHKEMWVVMDGYLTGWYKLTPQLSSGA